MSSDAELNELISKFRALQQSHATRKLNDRNTVEIINLLLSRRLLELVFTTDGKSYLTRAEVRREIAEEVSVAGGRIALVELPNLLRLDMVHIERAVAELKEDPAFTVVDGDIITEQFRETCVQEAAGLLRERGSFNVADFSQRQGLSIAYTAQLLNRAIGCGDLSAISTEGTYYTKAFVAAQRRRMLCSLLGAAVPTTLQDLERRHNLLPALAEKLYLPVTGQCAALGRVVPGNTYTPHAYETARARRLKALLMSNYALSYEDMWREGVPNPRLYASETFNPPSSSTAASLTTAKKGGRSRKSKTIEETPAEVHATAEYPLAGLVLSAGFLADRFFDTLASIIDAVVADETPAFDFRASLPSWVDYESEGPVLLSALTRHYAALKDCIGLDGGVFIHPSVKAKVISLGKKAFTPDMSIDELQQEVTNAFIKETEIEDTNVIGALLALDEVRDAFEAFIADAAKSKTERVATARKEQRQLIQSQCAALWADICHYVKAVAWLAEGQDATAAHKQLLQRCAQPIVSLLLHDAAIDHPSASAAIKSIVGADALATILAPNMQEVVKKMPQPRQGVLANLVELCRGNNAEKFINELEELCRGGEINVSCFHSPNKQAAREWAAVQTDRIRSNASRSLLAVNADIPSQFADIVSLTLLKKHKLFFHPQGKVVGSFVSALNIPALTDGLSVAIRLVAGKGSATQEELNALEEYRKTLLEE